jgi:hypothetical protein
MSSLHSAGTLREGKALPGGRTEPIFLGNAPRLEVIRTWGLPERPEVTMQASVSKLVTPGKRSAAAERFPFFCSRKPGRHSREGAVMRQSVKLNGAAAVLRRPVDV